jgi:hypothetical protein
MTALISLALALKDRSTWRPVRIVESGKRQCCAEVWDERGEGGRSVGGVGRAKCIGQSHLVESLHASFNKARNTHSELYFNELGGPL